MRQTNKKATRELETHKTQHGLLLNKAIKRRLTTCKKHEANQEIEENLQHKSKPRKWSSKACHRTS